MRPAATLDGGTLRANAAAFAALGGPVAAVVKNDGYGWGARRIARELDGVVESYVVADEDELADLRPATDRPIRLLADVPAARFERVLALGGIPTVSSREAVAAASAAAARRGRLTVRVGILDATGWNAIRPDEAGAFARALAGTGISVELWTHVTSTSRSGAILEAFAAARRVFEEAGVPVAGTDVASTASASAATACDRLRIGVGLFGARLGATVPVRCAIRLCAPVVRTYDAGKRTWAGYGDRRVPRDARVAVLRCGYGDGFPKGMEGSADILAVGMQYTTRVIGPGAEESILIAGTDDVDELAARAGITSHELVVGLAQR
jgi:alanine racemase